jgi:H+-transporting ATPase
MATDLSAENASHPTSASAADVNPQNGLTSDEAHRRLEKFGPNAMPDTSMHPLRMALEKFWAPVPWMLEAAVILELVLGKYIEAGIIAGLLAFNAALGLFQESRAQATLAALKSRLALNASVRRDGAWKTIPASELVPGDVVKLSLGGVVAADVHITGGEVLLDQSMLTGESVPIEAGAGVQTFAGALVRRGEAVAEVTATGTRTKFGRTAELVRTAHVVSSQQKAVLRVVRNLAMFNGVVVVTLVAYAYFLKMPLAEIIPLVLTAILASIPVALPATFTLASALGARSLAKLGVLPTRLSAVDEAGTTDVLCADKTGTLTQNALTVTSIHPMPGLDEAHVLALAALASSDGGQDPVDGAIRAAAAHKAVSDAPKLVKFAPFDPAKKMSEATATDSTGTTQRIIKGAFAAVIGLTQPSPAGAATAKELEGKGFRVLAVAAGPATALKLAGIIALSDPPRADSAKLVTELHGLGVRTVMVTGDAPATAAIVARAVGLDGAVCPPGPIPDSVHPEQFAVFAGVLPEDKYKLVKAFQKGGHTVGMCGDGANDAPALRQAQIGIAVSTATDVAKSAAGMVLTEAGLAGIVAAVKEGRITFQRILTYTLNTIIKKIVTVLFLIVGLIMTGHAILTPLLMVIVMVTGDFLSMSLTTDNVRPSPTPNAWRIGSLTMAGAIMGICLLAFCTGVLAVGRFGMNLGTDAVRTLAFVVLVFGGQATIYAIRERRHLWGSRPSLFLAASSVADIAIASTLAVGGIAMTSLPALLVGGTFMAAAAFAVVLDFVKVPVFARLGITQSQNNRPLTHETQSRPPQTSDTKPEAKGAPTPQAKAEPQPDAKAAAKPEAEAETKPDAKPEATPEAKTTPGAKAAPKPEAAPEAKAAPHPEAKSETKAETKPEAKPEATPEAKTTPDAKAEPKPEAAPEAKATPDAKAEPKPETAPEAKAAPQPDAKAEAKPEAEPKPQAKADVAALLNTSLGDLLVAGLIKDPEDAGRLIAAAIAQAEAPIAAVKTHEADAEFKPDAKAEPSANAEAAPASTPQTPK